MTENSPAPQGGGSCAHITMQRLGHTRSAYGNAHMLLTPDTFVRAPLPGMERATAVIHTGPAVGAAFTQYTAEFEADGSLGPAASQRFVFVIEGELTVGSTTLRPDGYAYLPPDADVRVASVGAARAAVI